MTDPFFTTLRCESLKVDLIRTKLNWIQPEIFGILWYTAWCQRPTLYLYIAELSYPSVKFYLFFNNDLLDEGPVENGVVLAAVPAEDSQPSANINQQPKVGMLLYVQEVLSIYLKSYCSYFEFWTRFIGHTVLIFHGWRRVHKCFLNCFWSQGPELWPLLCA